VTDDDHIFGGAAATSGGQHLNGDDGLDVIDASLGTADVVSCGLGDGDIWIPGTSLATNASGDCEITVSGP
jgi:hypothetical protein